jgi:pilus assembly protein CpaD
MMSLTLTSRFSRTSGTAIALGLGLALSGCAGLPSNRTLESIHQPVVERTNYTLDVTTGPGGLSVPEQQRLTGWFEAMALRYGDRIAIDDPLRSSTTRATVEELAGRYGLLVNAEAPLTPGYVNAGSARVIITRSKATVPHCPDWSAQSDANPKNGLSSNYGCATNGNFAAMVANPEHLLKGEAGRGNTVVLTSNKVVQGFLDGGKK